MSSLPPLPVRSRLSFDQMFGLCQSLCFSPDGRWLAGASAGEVRVWEMPSGVLRHELDGCCVAFTPEGDLARVVSQGSGQCLEIVELSGGEVTTRFALEASMSLRSNDTWEEFIASKRGFSVSGLIVSPDGSLVAGTADERIYLWNLSTGRESSFATGDRNSPCVVFAPDGQSLLTRGYKTFGIWSLDVKNHTAIQPDLQGVGGLAVSSRGLIAMGNGASVEMWTFQGEFLGKVATPDYIYSLAFDRTEKWLAAGAAYGTISLIDVEAQQVHSVLKGRPLSCDSLAWSKDGTLATSSGIDVVLWSDHRIGTPPQRAQARSDDGDLDERLERIRAKIKRRGVNLRPPVEHWDVEAFEAMHNIRLPEGYRRFILEIGDGGDGPPGCRFYSLHEPERDRYNLLVPLDVPFPLTEGRRWEEEEEGKDRLQEGIYNGYLIIGNEGCGEFWGIIVTGAERGNIWNLCYAGDFPVRPRRDFLSWYEFWLDGGKGNISEEDED